MQFGTCWEQWELFENTEEQNWFSGQTRGTPSVMGDSSGSTKNIDSSRLLSAYSGKMMCLSCSISHPYKSLCEPGTLWVFNEWLLKIVNRRHRNDSQVTERKLRVQEVMFQLVKDRAWSGWEEGILGGWNCPNKGVVVSTRQKGSWLAKGEGFWEGRTMIWCYVG